MKLLTALLINAKNLAKSIFAFATDYLYKQETGNINKNGNLMENINGLVGFSGNNYIQLTNSITTKFKAVFHVYNNQTVQNVVLICVNESQNYWFGIKNYCLGRENYGSSYNNNAQFESGKYYWFGIEWEEYRGNLVLYLLEDNGIYTVDNLPPFSEWTYKQEGNFTLSELRFRLGYNPSYSSEYWRGSIDLKNSYIINTINDEYIFNGKTAQQGIDYSFNNNSIFELPENELYGFSGNNYIQIPIENNTKSMELVIKAHTSPNTYNDQRLIQYSKTGCGFIYRLDSGNQLRLWMSNNGSDWNIFNNTGTGLYIPTNTDVWFRMKWDGSIYYIGYSLDGEEYTEVTYNNTTAPYFYNNLQSLGGDKIEDSTSWKGTIDIQNSYLKINGKLYWEGKYIKVKAGEIVNINEGLGFTNYKWNAFPKVTKYQNEFTLESKIKSVSIDNEGNRVIKIKEPKIPTNEIQLNTGTLYDCYSDNINDVYLKYGDLDLTNDYRTTNTNCIQGEGWTKFAATNNSYLRTVNNFNPGTNNWEINISFVTGNNITDSSCFISGHNEQFYDIEVRNGKLYYWLSSNGSSWNEADTVSGVSLLKSNTKYYIKSIYNYNDNLFENYISDDGINYKLDYSKSCILYPDFNNFIKFGLGRAGGSPFLGSISIKDTKIYINNNLWFDGAIDQMYPYSIVGSPIYLPNNNSYFSGANSRYLYLNTPIDFHELDTWAITLKVKYYSFRDDRIICNRIKDYVTPVLSFNNNKAHLWLSSNGTSWNITSNRESSRTLSTNVWYYIKLYFTGSAYKLDVSTTGEFNGEEINYINYSNSNRVYSDNNSIISLLNNGWSTGYYSNAILDISESYITLDNNTYQLGEANVNSQFYEKVSDSELSPISINAKVNMDNNLIINNSIYSVDTSKDIVIPLNHDIIFTDSTDGNSEITLKISEDNYEFKSNALLTEKRKYIDTSKYFSFDLEYLNGYNTKVIIEGKEYKPYELPCYVIKDMNIQIILNKTNNPTGSYIKSFWLNQSQFYKKQILTIKSNLVADKISAIVNSTCLWQATNTDELIIEVYEGDHIDYKIEKTQYANIESFYDVPKLFANSNPVQEPEKTIDEEFIRVYRYEFDVNVNDAKIELSSSDTYQVGDNWIEVFEGADIYYTITKDSYETEEGVINNVTQDITRNINLNPILVESVTAEIYPINITNVNCDIYKDTNDHYIASGRNSNSTLSNYTYLLNDPVIFPLDIAKSWEIQTTYRYLGGGDYQTILGSSRNDWHYGGLNFYTRENRFRLDFVNNKNSYYFNYDGKGDLGITPELGYSYKFKIGQIIEDNEWTANDGGGTKSTIYVDYIKSDRNTTENIELTTNGTVGGSNYACESCDNADTTFKCFNSTFDDEESEPTVTMSYESLTDIISQANPASITIYQSSTPMKFEKITFINSTTNPLTPKIGVVKGSNNESNWDDLAQIEIPNNNPGYKTEVNIMTGNTYKYIRCYFTESWVAQGISFQEIQLYRFSGAFAPTQLPTVQNPIWLTYYTPVAIRPTSFTLVNNKSLQNMKNGVIEGSTDNLNWDTLYTIENRAQCKGLSSNYKVTTNNKYNYFRLKITERYSDYKESYRDYYLVNNTQLQASINSDFFTKCLYGDINNGIANFEYKSIGWTLNNNSVNIANYLSIPSINTTSNIVENPTKVYTGFSSSDWINLPGTYLNLKTGYIWEIVIKVKFDSTSGTQNIISFGEEDNYGFLGYLDNGRLRLYAAIGGRNWNIGGDRGDYTYQTDTWYWIRWSYDGYYYYVEYSTDGQTWTTDLRVRNSGVLYSNNQTIYFGHRRSHTNEYLRGYIDINDTYIQVNSGKIFDGATLVNPIIGDKLDVYYSTRIESIPTTYTSLKRFIIDGFPFTYTGNYTRILNDIRNEKQYNIVNGDLVLNPNYIENKNPYVSVPLSFLGSSLESSSHYSLGSIDLTETKCYINNELYWEAIKNYNVNDEVALNRGYGLFNNQWMITGQTKEYTGLLSKRAKIDSINDNQANVTPLYYTQNEIEIIPKDGNTTLDADIVTSYELPTKNITINAINEIDGTGINDAIISVNTYSSDERNTCLVDNYREFHIEQIPGQVIEFYINSQKYILNDDNPVLIKRVQLYNTPKNDLSYYYYKIYENNILLQDVPEQFLNDRNVIMLAHKFKINVTNETGCSIIYKIGDKVYNTIDGLVNCYSQQTIEYTIFKQGYVTETGSFTIPIECVTSRMYIINITLDESITLTVNSSENDSQYNIECKGYEQVNNTITLKEGNVILEGDNLQEIKFNNNGCTVEVTQ